MFVYNVIMGSCILGSLILQFTWRPWITRRLSVHSTAFTLCIHDNFTCIYTTFTSPLMVNSYSRSTTCSPRACTDVKVFFINFVQESKRTERNCSPTRWLSLQVNGRGHAYTFLPTMERPRDVECTALRPRNLMSIYRRRRVAQLHM